jgi:hypothetical protein
VDLLGTPLGLPAPLIFVNCFLTAISFSIVVDLDTLSLAYFFILLNNTAVFFALSA